MVPPIAVLRVPTDAGSSRALQAGVHPKVVPERLGDSAISIALDLYSHVVPGMPREAAEKVAALVIG